MKPKSIAIVGAAETTELGRIPELSQIGLHADAALNAMKDAGIGPKDIDGIATAGETPTTTQVPPRCVENRACSIVAWVPTTSKAKSTPPLPLRRWTAATGSSALASTTWVAPSSAMEDRARSSTDANVPHPFCSMVPS